MSADSREKPVRPSERDWWRGRELRSRIQARPYTAAAVVLSLAAGGLIFFIAHELFPYHSLNDDEGVYLQQATMLLDGRLFLTPGSEVLREAFHPWFFVERPRGLYPKYAPVPAAVFALGMLAGEPRLALAVIAVTIVGLGYALAAMAFDRPTGLLAAAILIGAPLFLVNTATFLPYATTTALNLLFAVAYVRANRVGDRRYAALAGGAIGLAFFARPYTAVLFATPFLVHAIWRIARAVPDDRPLLARMAITAGIGLGFVALTLGYNAVTTGSALRFPYAAFAPLDGVGFGRRAILGHEVSFTPRLALRANATVLWQFAGRWFTAGLVGSGFAVVGLVAVGWDLHRRGIDRSVTLSDRQLQLLLAGVLGSVVLGNVAFWGNLNILGRLGDPSDGLVAGLGPFYHYDLLLPLSAFAAHGVVVTTGRLRRVAACHFTEPMGRLALLLVLVLGLTITGAAEGAALDGRVDRNAAQTGKLATAYAPFESTELSNALVFLPTPYGEWLNHPFQYLRNEPGFDGPTVYALSRNPGADFAVIDAYPDRTVYRYRYHGIWTPDPTDHVIPRLEQLRRVRGDSVTVVTTVTIPDRVIEVRVAVSDGETVRRFDHEGAIPRQLFLEWTVSQSGLTVTHPEFSPSGATGDPVPIDGPSRRVLTVIITEPGGGTLAYRQELTVRPSNEGVELLWPPSGSVCTLVTDCGFDGTYLPDQPSTRPSGIAMNTTLEEGQR